jgi:hypothetical protein
MKALTIIKYVFAALGSALLVGAFVWYQSTKSFVAEAQRTEGSVVELVPSGSGNSVTYRPVVRFTAPTGEAIEFTTASSSNPPGYAVGEKVGVLYAPSNPRAARIEGLLSLWGGPLIVGGLGVVFLAIGGGMIAFARAKHKKAAYLREHGTPIKAEVQGVELNTSFHVNGRHPFRVLVQWQNPATSELHIFRSDNLWFDPSTYLDGRQVTVFIERENPKKFHVDLSFLPKVAS